jgi:hypothetical protein
VAYRLAAILVLGLGAGFIGMRLIDRLLNHLRREGTLGLS